MTALARRFGQRIDAARRERGWTYRELAEQAGVHIHTAESAAQSKRGVGLEIAYQLARALGKGLDELTAEDPS